jgi:hypothetical protein
MAFVRRALALLLALAVPATAAGEETSAPPAPPAAGLVIDGADVAPALVPEPDAFELGPFANPFEVQPNRRPSDPAQAWFESYVEVQAEAPKDLNATMQVWWRHFDFQYSIYGRGYNLPDDPTPSINLMPLVDWAAKQIRNHRRNRAGDDDEGGGREPDSP